MTIKNTAFSAFPGINDIDIQGKENFMPVGFIHIILYCLFSGPLAYAAENNSISLPLGLESVKLGMRLEEFSKIHPDAQNGLFLGTTNIDLKRANQVLYLNKQGNDPEFGKLGTNLYSVSIRNNAFKNYRLVESGFALSGDPGTIMRIQRSIIADCVKK